jgi:hypothetical protein
MNRLIVLNRFFYPDHSATSQILTDLMRSLAAIAGQSDHSANAYIPRSRERPASPHPSDYVDEDFGIAPGRKIAPESFQLGAQLRMVVNFAVKSNNPAVAIPSWVGRPNAPFQ